MLELVPISWKLDQDQTLKPTCYQNTVDIIEMKDICKMKIPLKWKIIFTEYH
jgi:hypothetical protein